MARSSTGLASEEGLTLVELLVAVFLLAVGLLAVASTAGSSLVAVDTSRDRQLATAAASSALEAARAVDYHLLQMDSSATPTPPADGSNVTLPDGTTEPAMSASGGAISPYRCVGPAGCWFPFEGDDMTVTTYVTAVTETFDSDGDGTIDGTANARRVTAIVEFVNRGTTRQVVQNTIVSEARRGLPAPEFSLTPTNPAGDPNEPNCFDHTITNEGALDSYDVHLEKDSNTDPDMPAMRDNSQGWKATAYFDGVQMVDTTGDGVPDSPTTVDRNESVSLRMCYEPIAESGIVVSPQPTLIVRVRSLFDPSVTKTASNTVILPAGTATFYLHGDGNATWTEGDLFTMDDVVPTLSSYDADGDGVDGLGLTTGETGRWEGQLTDALTVSSAGVRFWAQRDGEEPDDEDGDGDVDGTEQITLTVTVYRGQTATGAPIASTTQTVGQTEDGWVQHDLNFALGSTAFLSQEFISIEISCEDATTGISSPGTCHVGFDTTSFPSFLEVSS